MPSGSDLTQVDSLNPIKLLSLPVLLHRTASQGGENVLTGHRIRTYKFKRSLIIIFWSNIISVFSILKLSHKMMHVIIYVHLKILRKYKLNLLFTN